jgi:predicted metalloprotease with PDZ domain
MRTHTAVLSTLSVFSLSSACSAQVVARAGGRGMAPAAITMMGRMDSPRAVIGISTSTSTGARDTLGLLVSSVTRDGPAEKAGIEEGNRIAAINGVSLKLAGADLDDPDMQGLMSRRLVRELDKVKPGDEVDLRVYGSGQTRSMKVKTVSPDSLYDIGMARTRRAIDDRPSLGIGIGSMGSKRDTLGIFVMSVEEDGPAAKAGIEEGQRISAINGVDLRVAKEDAGDDMVSMTRINRFERELQKTKAGDAVTLRVYANGQHRDVKVNVVAASTLNRSHSVRILRGFPSAMMQFDGDGLGETLQRAVEKARTESGAAAADMGHTFDQMLRLGPGGTVRWFDDETPMVREMKTPVPSKLAPQSPRKLSTTISM